MSANLHWWALCQLLNQPQMSNFDCEESISICNQLKDLGQVPAPLQGHLDQQGMNRLIGMVETSVQTELNRQNFHQIDAAKDPLNLIGDNL